jgi:hypothetical protein
MTSNLYLTVEEQDIGIRRDFPNFHLVATLSWIGIWEGTVGRSQKRTASESYSLEGSSSMGGP